MRTAVVQVLFVMASLLGTSAQCAGPVLTPQQVQAAIQEGSKYKTIDQFLERGLKGKRVKLAGAMAKDGISKYATFFNDWQAVAKGLTVDAILVVQSEVYRGPAANQQVMDLEAVLPHAFGIANSDFSTNAAQLAAATNVFVGITRARELLALALRRDAASDALLEAARQQGWHVRDLT